MKMGEKEEDIRLMQIYLASLSKPYQGIPMINADGDFG